MDISKPETSSVPPAADIRHIPQKALARRWNISTRSLERWRVHGTGPRFIKLNGRVIYRIEDVEAFEAARLRESTSVIATAGDQPSLHRAVSARGAA